MNKKLVTNLALMLLVTTILATEFVTVANSRINRHGGNFSSSIGVEGYSDPNCGKDVPGKRKCKHDLCCSRWGFCGSTEEYCGDGCQSGYGAPCGRGDEGGDEPPSDAPPPCSCSKAAVAEEYYSVLDDDDESSSAVVDHGKYDDPNCGKGKGGGGKCGDGLCCSEFGFCGSRDVYCGTGCQHGYGRCHGGGGGKTPPGGGGGSPPPGHQKSPPHQNKPPPGPHKPPPGHSNSPPRGGGHRPPPHSRAPPPCTC